VRRPTASLIFATFALAYPLVVLAGGLPRFHSRGECVRPATPGHEIEAVLAHRESELAAVVVRDRALEVGFTQVQMVRDACGRMKVLVPGIPNMEVGREFADEARGVGFSVTLEQAG
jgi:hypothetical protein